MKVGIIGLGRFGFNVANTLTERGIEVLAIDSNEAIIASVRDVVTQAVCLRVADETSLRSVGIEEMDVVIVAMGEHFAQSILITAILKKKLHVKRVIARAVNPIHREILMLIGANETIIPEEDIGIRLAEELSSPFVKFFRITKSFSLGQMEAPESFVGREVSKLSLFDTYKIRCVGLKKDDDFVSIDHSYVIKNGDMLMFAGQEKDLKKITKLH